MHEACTGVDSHSLIESDVPLKREVKDRQTMIGARGVASTNHPNKRNKCVPCPFCPQAFCLAGGYGKSKLTSSRRECAAVGP